MGRAGQVPDEANKSYGMFLLMVSLLVPSSAVFFLQTMCSSRGRCCSVGIGGDTKYLFVVFSQISKELEAVVVPASMISKRIKRSVINGLRDVSSKPAECSSEEGIRDPHTNLVSFQTICDKLCVCVTG